MDEIKFNASRQDHSVIREIAERAYAYLRSINAMDVQMIDVMMDIEATHCNGNPLKLRDLRDADQTDFAHDILGIRKHLDRTTGKLGDCFSPRYSQPSSS